MRISDWSSDVCSSDLAAIAVVVTLFGNAVAIGIEHLSHVSQAIPLRGVLREHQHRIIGYNVAEAVAHAVQPIVVVMAFAPLVVEALGGLALLDQREIGSASCRERVCQFVKIWVVAFTLKKKT